MKFEATIESGKLKLKDKPLFSRFIAKNEGEIILDVYKPKKKRSTEHNSYYWGYVASPIADMIGQHKLVFHEQIKCHLYGFKEVGGLRIPNKDTHDMNKEEFQIFIEDVKLWAFEFLDMTFEPEG